MPNLIAIIETFIKLSQKDLMKGKQIQTMFNSLTTEDFLIHVCVCVVSVEKSLCFCLLILVNVNKALQWNVCLHQTLFVPNKLETIQPLFHSPVSCDSNCVKKAFNKILD